MKAAAFDTSVLLKALRHRARIQKVNDDTAENARCSAAIDQESTVIVCPMAWLEVVRFARETESPALAEIQNRIRLEPVDDDVVIRAVALMRRRVQSAGKNVCEKCGNPPGGACSACGQSHVEKTKLNDYIIVAHAESLRVGRLYTTDAGMLAMGGSAAVEIVEPPNLNGPLFAQAESRQKVRPPISAVVTSPDPGPPSPKRKTKRVR